MEKNPARRAFKASTSKWVGILTEEWIGDRQIYSLEWMPRSEMNSCTGPTLESVLDLVDISMMEEEASRDFGSHHYDELGDFRTSTEDGDLEIKERWIG